MTYLYKRSNWLWAWLIRHRLVAAAWKPLVHATRWRQQRFIKRLERRPLDVLELPTPRTELRVLP